MAREPTPAPGEPGVTAIAARARDHVAPGGAPEDDGVRRRRVPADRDDRYPRRAGEAPRADEELDAVDRAGRRRDERFSPPASAACIAISQPRTGPRP
jgi:hypothetical protein